MPKFSLPKLPYAYNALEPHIDAKTMEIHHMKHHQTYVDKLNAALEKHPGLFKEPISSLLSNIDSMPSDIKSAVQNHGGGHANHSLFWEIMTPHAKENAFTGEITEAINNKYGNFDVFKQEFNDFALKVFGSGWTWLVLDYSSELSIMNTANQDSPLMFSNCTPLLGLDVWEHAYYLKHQNKRADYVTAWWNVVNWKKVNEIYLSALK